MTPWRCTSILPFTCWRLSTPIGPSRPACMMPSASAKFRSSRCHHPLRTAIRIRHAFQFRMAGLTTCQVQLQLHSCSARMATARFASVQRCSTDSSLRIFQIGRVSRPAAAARSSRAALTAAAAGQPYVGSLVGTGLKVGVVVARFNDLVTKPLLEGALEAFSRHGVALDDVDVAWVPGSFELPVVAKGMAKSGKYDAVVCIGAVIRGATSHYDAVVGAATSGVLGASTDSGVPVVFGVITTENMEQALDRAGGKVGNKGAEAAITAVEMANLLKSLREEGKVAQPW